jgi:Putative peptidoglycan binding domain
MVFAPMMLPFTETRPARVGAVCALILTCAAVPVTAARRQDSNDAAARTAAEKGTTAKKTGAARRHRYHAASAYETSAHAKLRRVSAKRSRRKKSKRVRGQQKIDSERATAIQQALIREHYLTGTATGTWNQASEDAMRRYQGDHGWQTKEVPDSRALIKLGLGPSKDHLLNPESAMTTVPDPPRSPAAEHAVPTPAKAASLAAAPADGISAQGGSAQGGSNQGTMNQSAPAADHNSASAPTSTPHPASVPNPTPAQTDPPNQ